MTRFWLLVLTLALSGCAVFDDPYDVPFYGDSYGGSSCGCSGGGGSPQQGFVPPVVVPVPANYGPQTREPDLAR